MYASLADRSTRRLLKSLANVDLLAIDELGYVNIKPEQTNIFFKLMEERHHRKPTLITTNLPYATWPDFLANPALTKALLSRLRERCHIHHHRRSLHPPSDRLIESILGHTPDQAASRASLCAKSRAKS